MTFKNGTFGTRNLLNTSGSRNPVSYTCPVQTSEKERIPSKPIEHRNLRNLGHAILWARKRFAFQLCRRFKGRRVLQWLDVAGWLIPPRWLADSAAVASWLIAPRWLARWFRRSGWLADSAAVAGWLAGWFRRGGWLAGWFRRGGWLADCAAVAGWLARWFRRGGWLADSAAVAGWCLVVLDSPVPRGP